MISLRQVSKSFDGGRTFAVREVTLEVAERAFVAIIGDSGSGKTTLLKMINRLVDAEGGTVVVAGKPVDADAPYSLRRRIGYVFQGIGLFPHLNVAENIGITPRLLGWAEADIRARVAELIDLVSLPRSYLERMPSELSGGQQQRVGVARSLAARPSIMLMDEPFGALDPITRDTLGAEYRHLHEQMGLTTVMVTHDVMEAVLLSDRIIVMRQGAIVADGQPHDLLLTHPDPGVHALMDMPRRQAERVRALMQDRTHRG
ncbi:MAG TPA: ATP-binding cassette domain-containing protein [Steroidobacteraceae bacterium]|jgi:osmoprotectant transport system ATP-binding protein|nr:ATP-binding cassette domain-containing protein [Steroidobacteraceae bacterium]